MERIKVDRRKLRMSLGSRVQRRRGTKKWDTNSKIERPERPRVRLARLVQEASQKAKASPANP